jgi:hypothetical protein
MLNNILSANSRSQPPVGNACCFAPQSLLQAGIPLPRVGTIKIGFLTPLCGVGAKKNPIF